MYTRVFCRTVHTERKYICVGVRRFLRVGRLHFHGTPSVTTRHLEKACLQEKLPEDIPFW